VVALPRRDPDENGGVWIEEFMLRGKLTPVRVVGRLRFPLASFRCQRRTMCRDESRKQDPASESASERGVGLDIVS
jgi:hypothetical protein